VAILLLLVSWAARGDVLLGNLASPLISYRILGIIPVKLPLSKPGFIRIMDIIQR
jgi:hypothetical protein